MFIAGGSLSDDRFISGAHVAILEGFFVGFIVVEISEDYGGRLD